MKRFNELNYIEGITIINVEGEILFTAKFNNKFGEQKENYEIVGKKFLDIYKNLDENTSSIYESMRKGVPVFRDKQILESQGREPVEISSVSLPIKSNGVIVGAIDLSVTGGDEDLVSDKSAADIQNFSKEILNSYSKVDKLNHKDEARFNLEDIITCNPKMIALKESIAKLGKTDFPIMIYGESGTGKELVAHSIHKVSQRSDKPFVVQNCGAIPATLIESLLFGTSKGAFTGAVESIGLIELADGGTLFLDEINSMPVEIQPKLLRVVQDGTFRRVGDKKTRTVDVRIISSTNETPKAIIDGGKLRSDLYFRLSMLQIEIPPLREREGDIPLLVNYFTKKYSKLLNRPIGSVSKNAINLMSRYSWKGNVRELENVIAYGMCVMEDGCSVLDVRHVEGRLSHAETLEVPVTLELGTGSLTQLVEEYEKELIRNAIKNCNGNVSKAAELLSIPRQTLARKAKGYGIV